MSAKRSRRPRTLSAVVHAPQDRDSVFDILYHDRERISSYLAQLDENGTPETLKHIDSAEDERGSALQDSVGVSAAFAKGNTQETRSEKESARRSAERSYDLTFSNSLAFLDYISDRNILERDFGRARLGQFVMASGILNIIDIGVLKSIWQSDVAQAAITLQAMQGGAEALATQAMLQIIPQLPHAVQAHLKSGSRKVWSALRPEGLITSASNLLLNHGVTLSGEWSVVGILDALPDTPQSSSGDNLENLEGIMQASASFSNAIREGFGRPASAFGMTPLIIFRAVGRPIPL